MAEALEPKLTAHDLKVLRAVPDGLRRGWTSWTIAKSIQPADLEDFLRTLRGLQHLGYIEAQDGSLRTWVRTPKGDRAAP